MSGNGGVNRGVHLRQFVRVKHPGNALRGATAQKEGGAEEEQAAMTNDE